jgi:hypothetical protein
VHILDPVRKTKISLDDAIRLGIFDTGSATYFDSTLNRKLTMVDAIDQGLIKIANKNFHASFKIKETNDNQSIVKNVKSFSIRYVVDPFTNDIIPLNIADSKKLVNLENGTYIGSEKIISLKDAFDKHLAFTTDDIDQPNSVRAKFVIFQVRKSTTKKNMSLKSALAKNWINIDRRVYIDKQTNEEMSFSQAIDNDLLVLKGNMDILNAQNEQSFSSKENNFKRNMSRESFQSRDSFQSEVSSKYGMKTNLEKKLKRRNKPIEKET